MTGEAHKYSRCQRFVEHHEPWTHPMSDAKERCKRQMATYRLISSGKGVHVCRQHAKEIDYRMNSNFYKTPDEFFNCKDITYSAADGAALEAAKEE